ncbi:MAG: TolC family protein, partial [Methylobacteriaceae bacterium]|nr:TolC family protein [Methylobacteriaceae bacterium]
MQVVAVPRPRLAVLRLAPLLVSLALASCNTVAPETGVPIPLGFREGRSGPAEPVKATWIRSFGSPELDRIAAEALAANLDIEAAIARLRQAQAQAVATRAALFPTINGTADVSRTQSSAARGGSGGGGGFASNSFGLGLSASYALDLFGRNRFAADAADASALAARF